MVELFGSSTVLGKSQTSIFVFRISGMVIGSFKFALTYDFVSARQRMILGRAVVKNPPTNFHILRSLTGKAKLGNVLMLMPRYAAAWRTLCSRMPCSPSFLG